ncbi:MAG: SprB repeat-containing protein [Bacteroidia bacterium]|nr:SprB repeat-containing protein [Bacteroidia bacterium]
MKKISLLYLTFFFQQSIQAQSVGGSSESQTQNWSRNDIFNDKVFIENMGQFDNRDNEPSSDIKYGIHCEGQQVYFNPTGLTYRYDISEIPELRHKKLNTHTDEENYEEQMRKNTITRTYLINMRWLNANPDAKIVAMDKVPEYFTYGDDNEFYKASAYKKILYKELYPHIDVEYIFHEKTGTKYSLILHPGADLSQVKMQYSGADNISMDGQGNIHLKTKLGDIIDHAPFSFYESNHIPVESAFSLANDIVSFKSGKNIFEKTVIVDPWTVGVTIISTNKALEVEKDYKGNIYVLGGSNNTAAGRLQLKKYTSAGALVWTYNPTNGFNGQYGADLKVDKVGNIYIVGWNSNPQLIKLNPASGIIWTTPPFCSEVYRMSPLNCDQSRIVCFGGQVQNSPAIYVNSTTGAVASTPPYTSLISNAGNGEDIRDWVVAPNGNYYGVTTDAADPNRDRVRAYSPALASLWFTHHTYAMDYWLAGYTGLPGSPSLHLIAVSQNFIYTTNGAVLDKRALANGAIITSVAIPGGIKATLANGNSGIILDTCNNVYVSSQTGVYKYDPNLNFISFGATTAAVYDICLGNNGEIVACGNGFLASVNMQACTIDTLNATVAAVPTGGCSNGNTGSATVNVVGGKPSYNYYWIPGGQTSKTVTGLGAGTYKVVVSDIDCNTDTAFVTISTSGGALSTSVTQTKIMCNGGSTGTATVSAGGGTAPYTYSWSNGKTTAIVTGLSANTYTVSVFDANGCSSILTVKINQEQAWSVGMTITPTSCNLVNGSVIAMPTYSPSAPYTFTWSTGATNNSLTNLSSGIYSLTVSDSQGCTKTLTANIAPSTNPALATFSISPNDTICIGTNVTFTNTGSTGTYYWGIGTINNGTTLNSSYTFNTVGTFSVLHRVNTGGCSDIIITPITVVNCTSTSPGLTSSGGGCVNSGDCSKALVSAATGGTPPYTYSWSNGATTSSIYPCATSNTTYTVTVTDAVAVTSTTTVAISINPAATFSQSPGGTTCKGSLVNFTHTGTTGTHSWLISPLNPNVSGTTTNFSYTFLTAGSYTVSHTVTSGSCNASITGTVTVVDCSSGPAVAATGSSVCAGICASVTSIGTGGTSPYTYSWSTGATTQNINPCPSSTTTYTVTIKDNGGNSSTSTAVVTINPSVTLSTSTTNVSCYGGTDGNIIANPLTGTPNYTYNWSGGVPGSGFQVSGLSAGNYTVTVTDNKGCTGTSTVAIAAPPILSGQFSKGTANCSGCGCKEWLMVMAAGGTSPYSYLWPDGYVNKYKNQLCPGAYLINIKDKNGCSININLTTP